MQTQSGDYTARQKPFFGGNRTIFLSSHKVWKNLRNLRILRHVFSPWELTCWGGGELFFCKKGYIYSIHTDHYHDIYFNIMALLFTNKYKHHLVYLQKTTQIILKNLPKYGEYTYCTSEFIQDMVQIMFA